MNEKTPIQLSSEAFARYIASRILFGMAVAKIDYVAIAEKIGVPEFRISDIIVKLADGDRLNEVTLRDIAQLFWAMDLTPQITLVRRDMRTLPQITNYAPAPARVVAKATPKKTVSKKPVVKTKSKGKEKPKLKKKSAKK